MYNHNKAQQSKNPLAYFLGYTVDLMLGTMEADSNTRRSFLEHSRSEFISWISKHIQCIFCDILIHDLTKIAEYVQHIWVISNRC